MLAGDQESFSTHYESAKYIDLSYTEEEGPSLLDMIIDNSCWLWTLFWFNPVFIALSIILLCSKARLFILLTHVLAVIMFTTTYTYNDPYVCIKDFDIVYIMYSILIPVFIFLLFCSIKLFL